MQNGSIDINIHKVVSLRLAWRSLKRELPPVAVPLVCTNKHVPPPHFTNIKYIFHNTVSVGIAALSFLCPRTLSDTVGKTGDHPSDVNGDGSVDIQDLILIAGVLDAGAAAPSLYPESLEILTPAALQLYLSQAHHLALRDATSQRGIRLLEQLLVVLTPKETALLANYPNSFNPETWIPYQLAKDANVTLTIYAMNGHVVRRLPLGHQPAGIYQSRSRAAYWDGKNAFGEPVASGLYFYTLTAGDFSATRKMLIRK